MLARAIATGAVAAGSVVAAEVRDGTIGVRVVRSGAPTGAPEVEVPSLRRTGARTGRVGDVLAGNFDALD